MSIRERFQYCILLLLVVVQTMKEFGWSESEYPGAVPVLHPAPAGRGADHEGGSAGARVSIRERFQYCILLLLVVVQTMKGFGWSESEYPGVVPVLHPAPAGRGADHEGVRLERE